MEYEYYAEESTIASPSIQVISTVSKWDKYDFCTNDDGYIFVVGFNDKERVQEAWSKSQFESNDILFDILILYKNISDAKGKHSLKHINQHITNNDITLIINFCNKYGLPFFSKMPLAGADVFQLMPTSTLKSYRSVPPFVKNCQFAIASFIAGLGFLFCDFLHVAAFNDWEYQLPHLINGNKETIKSMKQSMYEDGVINLFTPVMNHFITKWDSESQGLVIATDNLMHLAAYYLCLLAAQKFPSNKDIAPCEKCGKLYIRKRPNQKYCGNPCTPQSAYSKRKHSKPRNSK